MNKTKIEWVKNPDGTQGYTWNPITGCLNHTNGLCKGGGFPCYAYRLANGRLKGKYQTNSNLSRHDEPNHQEHHLDPFYPRFWMSRMSCQFSTRTPQGIFVCDMSDLFGIGILENWTWQVMQLIKAYPQHRFYLLTKQPQNLIKWSPFPENCWVGVTATDEGAFSGAFWGLRNIEARVKFISFEPLLSSMSEAINSVAFLCASFVEAGINWLIIGSQTKPYKPPKIEWVREIVGAADKAGIPVFLKDNLKKSPEFWNDQVLRQEMPV